MTVKIGRRNECDPAVLECSAGCGFAEHVYVGLRNVKQEDPLAGCDEVYECAKCKARRKWGVISSSFEAERLVKFPLVVV